MDIHDMQLNISVPGPGNPTRTTVRMQWSVSSIGEKLISQPPLTSHNKNLI